MIAANRCTLRGRLVKKPEGERRRERRRGQGLGEGRVDEGFRVREGYEG